MKIHLRSQIADINTLAAAMVTIMEQSALAIDLYVIKHKNKLEEDNLLMTQAIKERLTQSDLIGFDQNRDDAFRVLFSEISTKAMWPDPIVASEASRLLVIMENYGWETIREAYNIESAHINALLMDLEKEEFANAIALLPGLDRLISNLKRSQEVFEAKYLAYLALKVEAEAMDPAYLIKRRVVAQINGKILPYFSVMADVNPELYLNCFNKFTTLVKEMNQKVKMRMHQAESLSSPEAN